MTPERWRQIEELYHAVRERGPAVLASADPELRREVERLLAQDSGGKILDRPAAEGLEDSPVTQLEAESAANEPEREAGKGRQHPPWWMYLIAAAFLTHALFKVSVYFWGPEAVGLNVAQGDKHPVVVSVAESSTAHRGGIRPGDRLLTADGRSVSGLPDWYVFLVNIEAGVPYTIEVLRGGHSMGVTLSLPRRPAGYWLSAEGNIVCCEALAGLCYLAIACFMAFVRPRDLLARIGALMLLTGSAVIVTPLEGMHSMWRQWPPVAQALLWLATFSTTIGFGSLFTFFALFPRPSFRRSWIWAVVWMPVLILAPVINYYAFRIVYWETTWPDWLGELSAFYWLTYLPLSFALLAIKYRRLDITEKRRVRVIVAGLAILVLLPLPTMVYNIPGLESAPGGSFFHSVPMAALAKLLLFVFPLSFAYAILRHQLFDIRIIIRQGLRYAVARRLLLLAVPAIAAVFLLDLYGHKEERMDEILRDRGWIYLILAGLAVLLYLRRQRWLEALDRRFFREQYNAHEILRGTLQKVHAAVSLAEIAPAVVKQIEAGMHVQFCAIMEHHLSDPLYRAVAVCPDQFSPPCLPVKSKVIELSNVLQKPVAISPDKSHWLSRQLPRNEWRRILDSGISLLAPIRSATSDALLLLGSKRSEEPFTSEDERLVEDITVGLSLLPGRSASNHRAAELCTECPTCGRCYEANVATCPADSARLVPASVPYCLEERFKVQHRIGKGGMGVVYEAADLQLQRNVAIKVISQDWTGSSDAVERFRRESKVLAGFQHPNVVTLFDIGITRQGRPFLVMELLSGLTLRQELDRAKVLPLGDVRNIVHQVCTALSAAHRRSIIHRDLKPANIFLCGNADQRAMCDHVRSDLVVKILDFGLAKLAMEPSKDEHSTMFSTEVGQIAGTPAYISPEVLRGERAQRGADIWALSVMTLEMLTGQNPFANRVVPLLAACLERLPEPWSRFFEQCLASDPDQRPDSVETFVSSFDRIFG